MACAVGSGFGFWRWPGVVQGGCPHPMDLCAGSRAKKPACQRLALCEGRQGLAKKQIGLVGRLNMRCTLIPLHRLQLFAKRVIIQLTISVERMFYGAWICFFHWVVRCSRTACPACATGLWAVDADKPWAVAAGEALAGAAGLQGEQPVKVERVYSWGFVRYGRSGKLCT
jgi:hypothetical protein